ncbi:MAG TPA: hypothetical protein VMT66_03065 [Steroidobacteraceae bacterium]|nr:hypothetical protein [Steroidobacteraceae bacterium]
MNGLGILAALAAESRALGTARGGPGEAATLADGSLLVLSGIGPRAATEGARRLIAAGARALISWGMAGGLDPSLAAGCVVLPREVLSREGKSFATEPGWHAAVAQLIATRLALSTGRLLSSPEPLGSIAAKAEAFRRSAAVAVDMESAAVAEVASDARLPFLAVRAIVDTANDTVPQAALAAAGIDAAGVRVAKLLVALARAPRELAPLMRLGGRYRSALRALRVIARSGSLAPPLPAGASGTALG